jgi:hypothetical protein
MAAVSRISSSRLLRHHIGVPRQCVCQLGHKAFSQKVVSTDVDAHFQPTPWFSQVDSCDRQSQSPIRPNQCQAVAR